MNLVTLKSLSVKFYEGGQLKRTITTLLILY